MPQYRFRTGQTLAVLALVALGGFGVWIWGSDNAVLAMGVLIAGVAWVSLAFLMVSPVLIFIWAAFAIPLRLVRRYTGWDQAPAKEPITDAPEP